MPQAPLTDTERNSRLAAIERYGGVRAAAQATSYSENQLQHAKNMARQSVPKIITDAGYDPNTAEKTPSQAWAEHRDAANRKLSKAVKNHWATIQRPKGPFVLFHCTDEHVDDDGALLDILEADIQAAHDMNAIMVHGGDLLNNWPLAGKLARKWADQECTLPDALLRAQYFIDIFKPDVWVDGNHEEMNPYLTNLFGEWLPEKVIRDYWTARFVIETPGGRPIKAVASHKFQKGSSWFHKLHGHIREMLEAEEADIYMDGHLHSDGVMDYTLPERRINGLFVASAGYKSTDEYAARISRGGLPKMRGRAHWIVVDPSADFEETAAVAFKCPKRAEAYYNGLQNLRAA